MPECVLKKVVKTKEEKQRELQEVCFPYHFVLIWVEIILFEIDSKMKTKFKMCFCSYVCGKRCFDVYV